MEAGASARRLTRTTFSATPAALGGLFAAGILLGGLAGALVTFELNGLTGRAATAESHREGAAPAFDTVRFRAEERSLATTPAFDAVRFRAEERSLATTPAFDAIRFRAEERAQGTPAK